MVFLDVGGRGRSGWALGPEREREGEGQTPAHPSPHFNALPHFDAIRPRLDLDAPLALALALRALASRSSPLVPRSKRRMSVCPIFSRSQDPPNVGLDDAMRRCRILRKASRAETSDWSCMGAPKFGGREREVLTRRPEPSRTFQKDFSLDDF